MAGARMRRIDEALREVVAATVSELADPRLGFVTVTGVETSSDLRSARVYVSVLGDEAERDATLEALRSSHGVIQARIASEQRMKRTQERRGPGDCGNEARASDDMPGHGYDSEYE